MIPGPLFLIATPMVAGLIAYLLRRLKPVAALLAGSTTLLLAVTSYSLPLDRPARLGRLIIDLGATLPVLDRPLIVERIDQPALGFMFLVATALFWFGWRVESGPLFYPMGLALLGLFSAVLLTQPFQYAALLLLFAAAVAAFLIQGGRPGTTQAAMRYLVVAVIALPPILVAGWELDKYVNTPDEVELLRISAVLFACTFAVLLASVPFHYWVPAVGAEAPPLVAALLFTVGQGVVVAWLLSLLQAQPQLLRYLNAGQLFSWAGLLMVVVGGLLAFSRTSFGRLMGYASLIDMGALLMALGVGTALGLQAALITLVLRAFALILGSAGLSVLSRHAAGDLFEQVRGLGWRLPLAGVAVMLGGLSLAGFPLTPGFVGRWALLQLLAQSDPAFALVLFAAGASVAVGYMRGLAALLTSPQEQIVPQAAPLPADPAPATPAQPVPQPDAGGGRPSFPEVLRRLRGLRLSLPAVRLPFAEGAITGAMLLIGIAVCVAVAVAPQIILPWVTQAAGLYTFFGS